MMDAPAPVFDESQLTDLGIAVVPEEEETEEKTEE